MAQHRRRNRADLTPPHVDVETPWWRAVWDASPDAIAISDEDGIVISANPAYTDLYGFDLDQVVGQPFWIIFPNDQQASAAEQYRRVFEDGAPAPSRFEAVVCRANGELRTVESRVSFLNDGNRRVVMLSVIRDITEQQQAIATAARLAEENAVLYQQTAEMLRQREEFIAMASHELKNPLAALRGCAEILKRQGIYLPNMVDGIILQTFRIDRLIRNMLDFSVGQSGHLQINREPTDLLDLIRRAVEETQILTRQHRVTLEAATCSMVGNWDGERIDQVLQNLLNNAVKYSPDGGDILVRAEDLGDSVTVSVVDHGMGITADAMPRLFDRFYRSAEAMGTRAGGLGLGLAIAQMLVEAHGGEIGVRSSPGEGSVFFFSLPRHLSNQAELEREWTA